MNYITAISLLIAVILGYGAEWAAPYVNLFAGNQSKLIGDIGLYKSTCTSHPTTKSECTVRYVVPVNSLTDRNWIGVGSIISASRFICENGQVIKEYDNPNDPGQRFDLMTIYQIAELPHDCGSFVTIEAWSRFGATRKGHIGGLAIQGSKEIVGATVKLYEFFSIELTRLLTYLFFFIAIIQLVAKNFYDKKIKVNPLASNTLLWIGFLVFASNLGQTFLPIQNQPMIFNKIVALLSGFAHCSPIFVLAHQIFPTKKKLVQIFALTVACTYSFAVFTKFFPIAFVTLFFVSAVLGIALSITRKNTPVIVYSVVLAITAFKILNTTWLPSAMFSTIFAGIYLTFNSIAYVQKLSVLIGRVVKVTHFSTDANKASLTTMEKELLQLLGAKQLTFLYILPESRCEIRTYHASKDGIKVDTYFRDELPPVFAHVISNREPLWDAKPNDKKIQSIKTKSTNRIEYEKDIFSFVPLVDSHECYGAFAFTNYSTSHKSSETLFDQRIIAELSIRNLIDLHHQENTLNDSHNYKKLAHLKEMLSKTARSNDTTIESICQQMISIINKIFGTQGFIARLDDDTRQLHILGIDQYNDEITGRYKNGKVYAHKDNEQGPLAVSVNKQKVILIQDVRLYTGVFHEFTNYFFKLSKTNSCVSIPIFQTDSDQHSKVWGVLFLEATNESYFKISMKTLFEKIGYITGEEIESLNESLRLTQTEKALQSFIPEQFIDSYINNSTAQVKDEGLLLMIDLKSSTKISNHFGREAWLKNIELDLRPQFDKLARDYGFEFKQFTWDAFYLTLSAQVGCDLPIQTVIEFLSETSKHIEVFYQKHYSSMFYEFQNPDTPKARFCMSRGDISMGIVESAKNQWAITGQEMANLTKLESIAKTIQKENPYKVIYTDSSLGEIANTEKTNRIVPESGREVITFDISWGELRLIQRDLRKAS